LIGWEESRMPRSDPPPTRTLRHQLRTPLNHIIGYAELLSEEAESRGSAASIDLKRIHRAGQDLLALVDELASADRTDLGPLEVELMGRRFRAPLNAVIGYAELLQEEAADNGDWMLADLHRIREAAGTLQELVTPLLDAPARLASGTRDSVASARTREATSETASADHLAASTATEMILVVDDDPVNRDILARRVTRLGYLVTLAEDGQQALTAVREQLPELVLLDVNMPGLSGFDVLREIRADERYRELPVIVLSASNEADDAVRCLEFGADDYLAKQGDSAVLRARIESCLERKRLRDRELAYLRRTAQVTAPAAIADLLYREHGTSERIGAPRQRDEAEQALLRDLESELQWVSLDKGEALLRQGDPSDSFFVLIYGRLRIVREDEAEGPVALGEIQRGETVGEWGVLSGQPRSATIVAIRDSRLARISRAALDRLAEKHPRALTHATQDVIGRMREAYHARARPPSVTSVALVPLGVDVALAELAQALASELSAFGATLHLRRNRLEGLLGPERARALVSDTSDQWAIGWMNDLELQHRFVLYEADEQLTPWTRQCIRQADRVLLVGRAEGSPDIGPIEAEFARERDRGATTTRLELVLVHDARSAVAGGTRDWLDARAVVAHHHLAREAVSDIRRLARRLAGHAVGLVLGGGGMRGAAHFGVIKALEEAGIPIDLVGGTSAGSFVAGLYVLGGSPDHLHAMSRDMLRVDKPFSEYTLPLVALLTGRRLGETFARCFGSTRIEDLWLPYFCVASNLTRAEPVVYRDGSLWKAVRASCSIPAVLPPVVDKGDLLVDGGVLNNLPADVMAEFCDGGPVIASDLRVKVDLAADYDFDAAVSGIELLWRRLLPFQRKKPKAPGIAAVAIRASLLGSVYAGVGQAQRATYYINPPVGRFPMLDVRLADEMFSLGYQTAVQKIEEWHALGPLPGAPSPGSLREPEALPLFR
jgi:NTE family protein/lysophospholipid hydrolase